MKGCRPLEPDEISTVHKYFSRLIGHEEYDKRDLELRNKTLFFFSLYTGFRISEILSIRVRDVLSYGKIANEVYLQKCNTKGKKQGRKLTLNDNCKKLLEEYVAHYNLRKTMEFVPDTFLFFSRQGENLRPRQANNIFHKIYTDNQFEGKLATHTGRKTFAKACFEALGNDILALQSCMGHQSLASTANYVDPNRDKIEAVIKNLNF